MQKTGVIILAAGGSKRLGRAKQLLEFRDQSLLANIVKSTLDLIDVFPLVVTGSGKEVMEDLLMPFGILSVFNDDWESGMGTSIKTGLKKLTELNPDIDSCLFAVCDQPFVTTELLRKLISSFQQNEKGIVAAYYNGTLGTPALFDKRYFNELLLLKSDEGAKRLILRHTGDLTLIPFAEGSIDIDTQDDYLKLINAER